MKRSIYIFGLILLGVFTVSASRAAARAPDLASRASDLSVLLGNSFTYQGRLEDTDGFVNNQCDFGFKLFSSPAGGDQVGGTEPRNNVLVEDGYFTVDDLDFGIGAFQGEARWLEVSVRCPAGSGGFETLAPRQEMTATPYALYSHTAPWGGMLDMPTGFADGKDNDTTYAPGIGMTLSGGVFSLSTTYQLPQDCGNGQVAKWNGGAWICADDDNSIYSAGDGLTLSGGQFEVKFGGTGSATSVSHSDHFHWGQSWSGSGDGLTLESSSGTGIYGISSSGYGVRGSGILGVYGESQSSTGVGVIGYGYIPSGRGGIVQPVGVYGDTYSGIGVAGITMDGMGVFGSSVDSVGVFGEAFGKSGINTGVLGSSYSNSGRGVVGDATATQGTTYGVVGYSASSDGYAGYFRNTSSGVSLRAQTDSGSGNIIEAWSNFTDREFRVERGGDVRADGSFTGGGADYAELLPGVAGLTPGEVLVIGTDGNLVRSTRPAQGNVVGVYSTKPGFVAGARDESADLIGLVPVAVMGVVPVKVSTENGPIQAGDLLCSSSTPGHAMRSGVDPVPGTIIGKALESWHTGTGVINMLVMLR